MTELVAVVALVVGTAVIVLLVAKELLVELEVPIVTLKTDVIPELKLGLALVPLR